MTKRWVGCVLVVASALVLPSATVAQVQSEGPPSTREPLANVQAPAAQAQDAVERTVRRFRIGVTGGVAFDPELIDFGAHGAFAPVFHPNVEFRPGVEFGLGEVTTLFGINLDVLYTFAESTGQSQWTPYFGAGPNFALSHRDLDLGQDIDDDLEDLDDDSRFDFSDTDFVGGFNFIAGARNANRLFFELKATAWGVSNVRLLAGFNF